MTPARPCEHCGTMLDDDGNEVDSGKFAGTTHYVALCRDVLRRQRDEAIEIALSLADGIALDETSELVDRSYGRNKEAADEHREIIARRGFEWHAPSYQEARATLERLRHGK